MIINGSGGDDILVGTVDSDEFRLRGGGKDTASGGDGDDLFFMGRKLDPLDVLDGGNGYDVVYLDGDYSSLLTFGAGSLANIEGIELAAGFDYVLKTDNANVAAGEYLTIDAGELLTGQSLNFDGSAEKNGYFNMADGAGDDVLTGGKGDDYFSIESGAETIMGNGGDDALTMRGDFGAEDSLNGGKGYDVIGLLGDYSAGLTVKSNMMARYEALQVDEYAFNLTFLDGVVGAGVEFTITSFNPQSLTFDGSDETNGTFKFNIIDGDCNLIGGFGDDIFLLAGQRDPKIAAGNDGDDSFVVTYIFSAGDSIDGGAGDDTLTLDLALAAGFEITGTMVTGIETLILEGLFAYDLVVKNLVVANNEVLTVDATALTAALVFDGSAETNGSFMLTGGANADYLTGGNEGDTIDGGAGDDVITGGLGADTLDGGKGTTVFGYADVTESTGSEYDHVSGFAGSVDQFDLDVTVMGVNKQVKAGALSTATFDGDLAAAVTASKLDANFALVFTASSGTLSGHSFLVIDANGVGGYQAGDDYVIELISAVQLPAIDTGSFI